MFTRLDGTTSRDTYADMAARAKTAPVGSAQWMQNERDQADEFVAQEVDEFGYSVRNELDWLNEHMAEIFSKSAVYADPSHMRSVKLTPSQQLCRRVQDAWQTTRQDAANSAETRRFGAATAAH